MQLEPLGADHGQSKPECARFATTSAVDSIWASPSARAAAPRSGDRRALAMRTAQEFFNAVTRPARTSLLFVNTPPIKYTGKGRVFNRANLTAANACDASSRAARRQISPKSASRPPTL